MGEYTGIKSDYIRKKVEGLHWDKHDYIDNLIRLYEFIRKPPKKWIENMHYAALKSHYRIEYLDLLREYSPELWEKELARQKKFEEEKKEYLQDKNIDTESLKADWIKAGGKP